MTCYLHISNDSKCPSYYPTWVEKILQLAYCNWFKMYFRLSNLHTATVSKCTSDYPTWLEKILELVYRKWFKMYFKMSS